MPRTIRIAERLAEVLNDRPPNRFDRYLARIALLMKLVVAGAVYFAAGVAISYSSNPKHTREPPGQHASLAPQHSSLCRPR